LNTLLGGNAGAGKGSRTSRTSRTSFQDFQPFQQGLPESDPDGNKFRPHPDHWVKKRGSKFLDLEFRPKSRIGRQRGFLNSKKRSKFLKVLKYQKSRQFRGFEFLKLLKFELIRMITFK
jgi:hypothetical protein